MRLPKAAWILIIVTTLGGMVTYAACQQGVLHGVFEASADQRLFAPGGLSQTDARALYAAGIKALHDGDNAGAAGDFDKIKASYPGLEELLALHVAEARSALSDESGAQRRLQEALNHHPGGALAPILSYRIAQSHFRAGEYDKAKSLFESIRRRYPKSSYATGSLYFLGMIELKAQKPDQNKIIADWREYLRQCPDCTYSADIAERLEPMIPSPTMEDQKLLGLAYANSDRDNDKALAHLRKASLHDTWLPLSKALLAGGFRTEALETVIKGLPWAKDGDTAQDAIDSVLLKACTSCVDTLSDLDDEQLKFGGDYILWQLAQLDSSHAQSHYHAILSRYPNGDYAPESSWNVIWPLLQSGHANEFLAKAEVHMSRYGYSRSAPKVLFWTAKVLEHSDRTEATNTYKRILNDYPSDYYAYRAWGRLEYLRTGEDPGWRTRSQQPQYPPSENWGTLSVLPDQELITLAQPGEGLRAYHAAKEVQAIGVPDDVALLVTEALGGLPPDTQSWVLHRQGDKVKAIRTIRDFLIARNRPDYHGPKNGTDVPETEMKTPLPGGTADAPDKPAAPTRDELELLYPVYFSDVIAREAPAHGIDPFLVQALSREESYFNEMAVSSSNALGLMQLLPATAADVAKTEGVSGFQSAMLFDPGINIKLGSAYLGYLEKTFDGNAMLAVGAYNGGPNAMKRWAAQSPYFASDPDMFIETIPYEQTRDYIKKVFGSYWNYNRLYEANGDSVLR